MRHRLVVVAAAVVALAVVGVVVIVVRGGDDGGSGQLSPTSAAATILTAEDLGSGYSAGDDEATSYARQAPGCLDAIRLLLSGAPVQATKTFHGPATAPASVVTSQVSSYPDAEGAKAALGTFRERTSGCLSVRRTNGKDGFELEVSPRPVDAPAADEQVGLRAVGAMVASGDSGFPFGLWVSVVRVGNNLAIVRLVEIPVSRSAQEASAKRIDRFTAAATARLVQAS